MSKILKFQRPLIPWSKKAAPPVNHDAMRLMAAEELQRGGQFLVALQAYIDLMVKYGPHTIMGNRAGFLASLALFQLHDNLAAIGLLRDDVIGDDPTQPKWANPNHHYNLGVFYQAAGMPREAAEAYRTALALQPDMATAENNLGNALREMGDVETAEVCFNRLLSRDPRDPEARYNLSYVTLLRGMLARGFELYEDRMRCAGYMAEYVRKDIVSPRFAKGQPPCRLFVHQEQGIGDTLQLLRFLPALAAQGHQVIFESPIELGDWLKALEIPGVTVITRGEAIPAHDLHLPMMSLPYVCGVASDADIPAPIAPPVRIPAPLEDDDPRPLIGLCWAGNPKHRNDHHRSMPVDALQPLLAMWNTRFVNLQVGGRGVDLLSALPRLELGHGSEIIDCSAGLTRFEATAALVQRCAAVVTVDTSIAHLAGALGVRTLALTSWLSEWRWQLDRTDSPWYPSVEIVRQPKLGDWHTTVQRARELLEAA